MYFPLNLMSLVLLGICLFLFTEEVKDVSESVRKLYWNNERFIKDIHIFICIPVYYLKPWWRIVILLCIKRLQSNETAVDKCGVWIWNLTGVKLPSPINAVSGSQYMFAVDYWSATPVVWAISEVEFPLYCYLKIIIVLQYKKFHTLLILRTILCLY